LNLNDIAENNLKMYWTVMRANLAISLPELYSSHYFVKEDVDNFALAELRTSVYCF
jgi:hypothetical protein